VMPSGIGAATRLGVAVSVTLGYLVAFALGAGAYFLTDPAPASIAYRVFEYGGTVLVCVLGPAAGFAVGRRLLRVASRTSWLVLVPIVGANLVVMWVSESFPAEIEYEWPKWSMPALTIAAPFVGALLGTFIRPGRVTFGGNKEPRRGIRIT
jgi:hypothetical protein